MTPPPSEPHQRPGFFFIVLFQTCAGFKHAKYRTTKAPPGPCHLLQTMPASWYHPQDTQSSRAAFQAKHPTGHQCDITLAQATRWCPKQIHHSTLHCLFGSRSALSAVFEVGACECEYGHVFFCFLAHMMHIGRLSFPTSSCCRNTELQSDRRVFGVSPLQP